jgi:hypothetical protein
LTFDLRDVVHARDTASHNDEHFYEISSKSLNDCRRGKMGNNFVEFYDWQNGSEAKLIKFNLINIYTEK